MARRLPKKLIILKKAGTFTLSAPTNAGGGALPTVTGIQTQGQTLGGSDGLWGGYPPPTYTYQWQFSADGSTGWTNIAALSTSATFVVTATEVGKYLRKNVTATNSQGNATASSLATGVIAAPLSISGTPATTATVGTSYSFTPTSAGGHATKIYSITNKPSWAAFTSATGQLTGTPSGTEVDTGVVITVTDGDGLTASLSPWTITVSAGGGAPTFDTTMSLRTTERNFVDVTSTLASVPSGNKVTVQLRTLSGSADGFALRPWLYPAHAPGAGNDYVYYPRELDKWMTIDTTSSPTGSGKAWVVFSWKNGANETGTTAQYVVGFDVSALGYTVWNYGAKTKQRQGGVQLTKVGIGTATAITQIKDKLNNVLSGASAPFEVWYGWMVWKSTNGTATSYGSARTVTYATSLTQTPYTVTFDNGDVLTVNAIDKQQDFAPPYDPALTSALGANSVQYVDVSYIGQFAQGDTLVYEDGDHNPTNILTTIRFNNLHTGLSGATLPTRPTGGTWNTMNLEQPTKWVTHTSRTPWGAKVSKNSWAIGTPDPSGTANTTGAGCADMRWCNINMPDGLSVQAQQPFDSNSQGCLSYVQYDHNYQDVSAGLTRHGGGSSTANGFYTLTSGIPGGAGYMYIHDNWLIGNTIAITAVGYDIEVIGNRIEQCSEDAIRHGAINLTPGSNASKIWFNFIPMKWWGNTSHPDYIQDMRLGSEFNNVLLAAAYPDGSNATLPATFGSTVDYGTMFGNMGCPDSDANYNDGTNVGGTPGVSYQLDDGEGFLGSSTSARYSTYRKCGSVMVSSMSNGFYVQNTSSASRYNYNTEMFDLYANEHYVLTSLRTWLGANGAPFPTYQPYSDQAGNAKNNFNQGGNSTTWTNCAAAGAIAPTQSNNNTTAYSTISAASAVMANPGKNWSTVTRIDDLLSACATSGAEASRGALFDKTVIDHRARTLNATSLLA